MHSICSRARPGQRGFSYIEALIATTLIGVSLVPALEALQSGGQASVVNRQDSIDQPLLTSKMEQLMATAYSSLSTAALAAGSPTTASSYSDTVISSDGRSLNRQVFLSLYDGDNADADNDPFTGTDPDLLWLRVTLQGTALSIQNLTTR